jgi:predicted TIM-barrel fold metal-dependent hydrolase
MTAVAGEPTVDQAAPASWVFDADGHVVEPPETWERYLPAEFRSYAPRVLQEDDHFRFICNDRLGFRIAGHWESCAAPGQTPHLTEVPQPVSGAVDAAARLLDMDVDSIDVAAVYPTWGLMIQGVTEPRPALALCRAVNDWIAEYVSGAPTRLVGVGVLPMTNARDALSEARRCVEELGFRGVWRRPEHFTGIQPISDAGYDALWSYLAEADVPFAFHPGLNGVIPDSYLGERYGDYYSATHAVHFAAEQMMALTTMVGYGILERHPQLRVAFLECGAAWVVSYLHRLDEHLEIFGFDRGGLRMRPSEYFGRQCYVSAEEAEPGLALALDRYPNSVVFASDYPHADGTFPGSTTDLLETKELSADLIERVMRLNSERLYGVRPGAAS